LLPSGEENGAHSNAAFLSWHREYILRVEAELQKITNDDQLTIPYWDWSDKKGTLNNIFVDAFMGGDGTGAREGPGKQVDPTHPFSKQNGWPIDIRVHVRRLHLTQSWGDQLRRNLQGDALLTEQHHIETLFGSTNDKYEDFRGALEAGPRMHNDMHGWIGGSMVDFSSPNDPIFMLNHSNIDRLWALWQSFGHFGDNFYPRTGEPKGHNLNDSMWPWNGGRVNIVPQYNNFDIRGLTQSTSDEVKPVQLLDCKELNYCYVDWPRVKEILDGALSRWKQREGFPDTVSDADILSIHGSNLSWSSKSDLVSSTARGIRLIEPNKVGVGRGFETNLIQVLNKGIPGTAPQMPRGGPWLPKIEVAEIAHWIDCGMPS